jgi:hypothetical protein
MEQTGRKTKAERLKETLQILKKLEEVGAGPDKGGQGYVEIKERLSEWVKNGEAWAGKIRFPSIGRIADCIFPGKSTSVASVNLRIIQ